MLYREKEINSEKLKKAGTEREQRLRSKYHKVTFKHKSLK